MPELELITTGSVAVDVAGQVPGDDLLSVDREEPVAVDAEHEARARVARASAASTPPRSRPTSCEFIASTRVR